MSDDLNPGDWAKLIRIPEAEWTEAWHGSGIDLARNPFNPDDPFTEPPLQIDKLGPEPENKFAALKVLAPTNQYVYALIWPVKYLKKVNESDCGHSQVFGGVAVALIRA